MYDWSVVCSVLLVIVAVYYWFIRRNYHEKRDIIHEKPYPFFGNSLPILLWTKSFAEWVQDIYHLHKEAKYVGFYDFNDPVIMIRDPELIKNITIKSFDHFVDHRSFTESDQEPLFSKNLFALRGAKWREVRTLLTPAFTSSKMKAMFKLMSSCGENFANYLAENAAKESTINSKDAFTKYTSDVIATCAFGVAVDSMRNPNNDFYILGKKATNFEGVDKFFKFFVIRVSSTLAKYLGVRITDSKVEAFFNELVRNTIETRDREGITRPDMIQLMMETRNNKPGTGPTLTIQDMVCQAFIFFFGGFDSTSSGMCFVAHLIATHPDVQKKLQEEVDNVCEQCEESVTYDAINNMKFLDAVINESLRLYPVQPAMDRLCTKSFELPPALPGKEPVKLEPGDILFLPYYALHRDPNYFPNPNDFRPERFIEDPKMTLHSPAYLPFGAGPRMCIGNRFALLEIKVLIFHLIAKCTLKPGKNMILPLELTKTNLAMSAKGGFWLELEPRHKYLSNIEFLRNTIKMDNWTVVWSILLIIVSIYYWLSRRSYFDKHGVIHEKSLPFVGNSLPILLRKKSFAEYIQDIYNLSSEAKYVGFYEFNDRVILIRDPELIRTVAIRNFDHFMNHRYVSVSDLDRLFSQNLFTLRGQEWREMRNLLTPAFSSSKLKIMLKMMSDCAANFTNYVMEHVEKESGINSKDAFTKYTADVIATCAFGVAVDSMKNPTNDFYVLALQATKFGGFFHLLKFLLIRMTPRLAKFLGIRLTNSKVEAFFNDLVKNTVETRDREGIKRPDMIQLMMESRNSETGKGPALTIQDMVCQVFIFILGGLDSSSTAMCFIAHLISTHPDVQKKLQDEVDDVYEQCGESITYEAINNMKFLDAVINESLRLYPVQTAMDRVCTRSFELPPALPGKEPLRLEPGDVLFLPFYALHRDPNYFPNPNDFLPERFMEDPKGTLHSSTYLPFGIGPRICIGNRFALLEIKVLIYHLICKCTLKPGKNMILPLELSKDNINITAKGGFWLEVQPRSK
ncbi:uncharacterized protein LOC135172998 [Diachasmimorpha longicaudata]|uniref:uncharacterized protein LOC135172998 n=1 Tax=Diachasmimorpha longicaudata TaxID=58733 RepID=UPI0030B8DD25